MLTGADLAAILRRLPGLARRLRATPPLPADHVRRVPDAPRVQLPVPPVFYRPWF